jgi:hypothetical protein
MSNELDLTEGEKQFLTSSSRVPEEIKRFMAHQKDNVGEEINAYRKVALKAKAKADAMLAVRFLSEVEGEMTDLAEANKKAIMAHSEVKQARQEIDALREENLRLRVSPSMAVSSED